MYAGISPQVYEKLYEVIVGSLNELIDRAWDEDNEEEADYLSALLDEFTDPDDGIIKDEAWVEALEQLDISE